VSADPTVPRSALANLIRTAVSGRALPTATAAARA
jgi:hypothetical protein